MPPKEPGFSSVPLESRWTRFKAWAGSLTRNDWQRGLQHFSQVTRFIRFLVYGSTAVALGQRFKKASGNPLLTPESWGTDPAVIDRVKADLSKPDSSFKKLIRVEGVFSGTNPDPSFSRAAKEGFRTAFPSAECPGCLEGARLGRITGTTGMVLASLDALSLATRLGLHIKDIHEYAMINGLTRTQEALLVAASPLIRCEHGRDDLISIKPISAAQFLSTIGLTIADITGIGSTYGLLAMLESYFKWLGRAIEMEPSARLEMRRITAREKAAAPFEMFGVLAFLGENMAEASGIIGWTVIVLALTYGVLELGIPAVNYVRNHDGVWQSVKDGCGAAAEKLKTVWHGLRGCCSSCCGFFRRNRRAGYEAAPEQTRRGINGDGGESGYGATSQSDVFPPRSARSARPARPPTPDPRATQL